MLSIGLYSLIWQVWKSQSKINPYSKVRELIQFFWRYRFSDLKVTIKNLLTESSSWLVADCFSADSNKNRAYVSSLPRLLIILTAKRRRARSLARRKIHASASRRNLDWFLLQKLCTYVNRGYLRKKSFSFHLTSCYLSAYERIAWLDLT